MQKPEPIETTKLCDFGCGQIAKFRFKNGKLYCSDHYSKCLINRKKRSNCLKGKIHSKSIPIETTELCSYGCGQISNYKLGNGKLCCEDHYSKCPINRKKRSNCLKGKIHSKSIPIETTEVCSYGCGQMAKYKLKNGKLCCSEYTRQCPINSKKISNRQKGKIHSKPTPIETTELCSYGCGQIANYKLGNGKLCCGDHYSKCPINRKKLSDNKPTLIETTKLCSYGCGQVAKFKFGNGKLCCSDSLNKCPIIKKKNRISNKLTIKQIKERYPTFYKVEDLRYNPDKSKEKEIQVRCNNHKCKNSKENNGWFTPKGYQINDRINQLEKEWGNDGSYFYCSEECKEDCPSFNLKGDPFKENKESPHTSQEINIWRQEVLKRQKDEYGYNFCEMCESKENLQVHHEKPQKTHPGMTLDPDNGIILCKKCHYKYGHKTGTPCSTGNLAHNPCD